MPPWGRIGWRLDLEQKTDVTFLDPDPASPIIDEAFEAIRGLEDAERRQLANRVLKSILRALPVMRYLDELPPLYASAGEDGSLLLEWIFSDFRIGFAFESDISESSWYLVSNQNLGGIAVSGLLNGVNIEPLITWLMSFVVIRSLTE